MFAAAVETDNFFLFHNILEDWWMLSAFVPSETMATFLKRILLLQLL